MDIFKIRERLIDFANSIGMYSFGRAVWKATLKPVIMHFESKKFHKNSPPVLKRISTAFDSVNVKSWLVYGTLLGYERNGDFIPHDNDIDLGVFLEDRSPKLEQALLEYGFTKVREYLVDGGKYGAEESYEYKGVVIDIFYIKKTSKHFSALTFYADEGESMRKTIAKRGGLLVKEFYFTPYDLKQVEFKGAKIHVPDDSITYLKEYYGPNYLVPDPNWVTGMAGNCKELKDKIGVQTLFLR